MLRSFAEYFEAAASFTEAGTLRKWSPGERRKRKRKIRRAHRGTNWNQLNRGKPRKGYKRKKVGDKRYVFERLSAEERMAKRRQGRRLGKEQRRLKS